MSQPNCPACGAPVEPWFDLCPGCGTGLKAAAPTRPAPRPGETLKGAAAEFVEEIVGLDRHSFPTLRALIRDPGRVARDARDPDRSPRPRPVRIYLLVSFLSLAFYAVAGRAFAGPPPPAPEVAPETFAMEFDLKGPNLLVGKDILAAIDDAGGVDPWLSRTGRLEGRPVWLRILATRALKLRSEGRFDEVTTNFAQNKALVSLLLIPILAVLLALIHFRRASLADHFNLAALLVSMALMVDVARQVTWLTLGAGAGLASPALLMALAALNVALLLWYVGRSTRTLYGLRGTVAAALAPAGLLALVLGYVLSAFVMNVVFILLG